MESNARQTFWRKFALNSSDDEEYACVCVCFAGSQHISPRPRDYFERIYLDGRFPSTAYVTTCRVPARNKTERRKTSDRQRAQETRENGGREGRAGVGREARDV